MKNKNITVSLILLWVLLLIFIVPFYVMFVGAFKNNTALQLVPPDLNPFRRMLLSNAIYVFGRSSILRWLLNSFTIGAGIAFFTVFISSTAGYAFAKKRFRGNSILFTIVILTMILPKQVLLVPNYLVAMKLHLTDQLLGVILTTVAPPFGIFLCRQFMQTIPTEMVEAAEIDGCSEIGKFVRIILPLSAPVLGALAIFSFITGWNDFLWQLIMISSREKRTVPIGIASFVEELSSNTGYQLMGALIATVPMLAVFLSCQKFFIKGITLGGVKG